MSLQNCLRGRVSPRVGSGHMYHRRRSRSEHGHGRSPSSHSLSSSPLEGVSTTDTTERIRRPQSVRRCARGRGPRPRECNGDRTFLSGIPEREAENKRHIHDDVKHSLTQHRLQLHGICRVFALGSLILKRKEDFVMRNKQVSGAGQTGLKRKQNDDRVLQNFSRLIW